MSKHPSANNTRRRCSRRIEDPRQLELPLEPQEESAARKERRRLADVVQNCIDETAKQLVAATVVKSTETIQ